MKLYELADKVQLEVRGLAINRADIDLVARATIKAMGFEVSEQTGEIYNPARDDGALSIANMPQKAIYPGMRSKHRRGPRR